MWERARFQPLAEDGTAAGDPVDGMAQGDWIVASYEAGEEREPWPVHCCHRPSGSILFSASNGAKAMWITDSVLADIAALQAEPGEARFNALVEKIAEMGGKTWAELV